MRTAKKLNLRALTSLTVSLSFLFIGFSGIMLYVSPKGRVANWTGWSLFGLSKEGWASAHTTMAVLFLVACALHIVYNWRPLLNYFKLPLAEGMKRSRSEVVGALAITLVVFLGTLWGLPPFSTVGTVGETIKHYWEVQSVTGPYAHAEEDTLDAFARKLGRERGELLERLATKGYAAGDTDITIKALAAQYDVSPATLFTALSSGGAGVGPVEGHGAAGEGAVAGGAGGGGYGRKTLEQVCAESRIELSTAISLLQDRGIEASGSDNVRTIANSAGMNPGELLETLGVESGH